MKHLHKFASVLLALVMAFSLMAPAFASGNEPAPTPAPGEGETQPSTTASVNIENPLENHKYTAYQIFTGTQAESEGALADVQWGDGINSTSFLTALQASNKFGDPNPFVACETAADVAAAISKAGYTNNSAQAIALAQIVYDNLKEDATGTPVVNGTAEDLPTGYYLIVDTTEGLEGDNIVYNAALLQLTKDITITTKVSVPQVDKKVQENSTGDYDEAADYSIGDTVPFQFIATIPDMSQFETYKYVFHDTMSEGLTFDPQSVKVTVGPSEVTGYTVKTSGFDEGDTCTFEIVFTDLKATLANVRNAVAGGEIVVTFNATLNNKAVIGSTGNSNTVKLEYSNNPNDDGDGNPPTGTTPEDKVLVFTYELDTNKVNSNNQPLENAEFYLADSKDADTQKWAVIENGKLTGWTTEIAEGQTHAGTMLTTPANGKIAIEGLDAGTYYLYETKAPAGYNTPADPFEIVISRTLTQDDGSEGYTDLKVTIDGKDGKNEAAMDGENGTSGGGAVGIDVVNQSGATLPETGGIGTTIFYVVGGVLAVGAVILLVTKKRMSVDGDK